MKRLKRSIVSILLAIVSVLTFGLFAGCLDNPRGEDPKDYYGWYYASRDGQYLTLEIAENWVTVRETAGIAGEEVNHYDYIYASQEYIEEHFARANPQYTGRAGLVVYLDSSKSSALIFWVSSEVTEPYEFTMDANGMVFTYDSAPNFRADMGDLQNYYCKYTADDSSDTWVEFTQGSNAELTLNGARRLYSYAYVTKEWLDLHNLGGDLISENAEAALILYDGVLMGDGDAFVYHLFEVVNKTQLVYGRISTGERYTFRGTGSEDIPYETGADVIE